jgi:hypothetical protein
MLAGIYHGWPTRLETQASTLEQSGKVKLSRAGGVHKHRWGLMVLDEPGARVIPWFKQILKVFVCGLAGRNGTLLKVL